MATIDVTIPMDNELKAQAQAVLDNLGLDISTAINVFFRHVVHKETLPFDIDENRERLRQNRLEFMDCMKGEVWMAEDFDAPLDEMKEYM